MSGAGTGFQERLPGYVLAEKVMVVVIKTCDIDIELTAQQPAIAEFVTIELFGSEIWIGVETSEEWDAIRRGGNVAGEVEVRLGIRRRPQGMCKGRPDGLLFGRCPEEAGAGLQLDPLPVKLVRSSFVPRSARAGDPRSRSRPARRQSRDSRFAGWERMSDPKPPRCC